MFDIGGGARREFSDLMDEGFSLFEQERFDEAEATVRKALSAAEKGFGPDSEEVHDALVALTTLLKVLGDPEAAEALARRRLEIATLLWGSGSEQLAEALFEMGFLLHVLGSDTEAEYAFRRFLDEVDRSTEFRDFDKAPALAELGDIALDDGRVDDADRLYSEAVSLIEANGLDSDPESFDAYWGLSRVRQAQDRPAEAETLLGALLQRQRRDSDSDPSDVADTLNRLASVLGQLERFAEAAEAQRDAIELAKKSRGADHPSVPIFTGNLASIYEDTCDDDAAEIAWKEAIAAAKSAFGEGDPLTIDLLSDYGAALYHRAEPSVAEPVVRHVVELLRRAEDVDEDLLAINVNRLAGVVSDLERYEEALGLYREALGIATRLHGDRDLSAFICLSNIGQALIELGRFEEAVDALSESASIGEEGVPETAPDLVTTHERLGFALVELERLDDAEQAYRHAMELAERSGRTMDPDYAAMLRDFGGTLLIADRPKEALELLLAAVDLSETMLGADHVAVADALGVLAAAHFELEDDAAAIAALERALAIAEADEEPLPVRVVDLRSKLGAMLLETERNEEAERVLAPGLALAIAELPSDSDNAHWARNRYASALIELERLEEAESVLREAAAALEAAGQMTGEAYVGALLGIGKVLQALGRFDEAESYLRRGVELDEEHFGDEPERAYSYARLAEVLDQLGKKAEMLEWRQRALELATQLPQGEDKDELLGRLERLGD